MLFFHTPQDDPTQTNLALALVDQSVAGQFEGKAYAYVPVYLAGTKWGLGVAEKNQPGYWPIPGEIFEAENYSGAGDVADGMNRHIGLDEEEAIRIVASSMRG